jgi:hypothetical protein
MNRILFFLVAALVTGCGTLPERYSPSPTRALVRGVSSGSSSVLIRAIDGGEVLWVRGYHLGDKVWLEPGVHKISVMCTTSTSWGSYMVGAEAEVDVQPGFTYFLATDPIQSATDNPHVTVTKKEAR